jgi:hypothetical protein
MELKDFIAQSLQDLVRGIEQAQGALEVTGAHINPEIARVFSGALAGQSLIGWSKQGGGRPIILVDFDIAVTVNEGTETKGGIGVVAGFVSLGSAGKSDQATSSATRLKFSVPVLLPSGGPAV